VNHRKKMKAGFSWLITRQLAANPKLFYAK